MRRNLRLAWPNACFDLGFEEERRGKRVVYARSVHDEVFQSHPFGTEIVTGEDVPESVFAAVGGFGAQPDQLPVL